MNESEKEKEFKALLARKYERSKKLIESFDEQRKSNTAFYLGDHWVKYDETNKTLRKIKLDDSSGEARITVNLTRKNVETLVSQILGPTPVFEAVPTSEQEADVGSARISERALTVFWDYFKVVKFLRSARRIAEILGDSFIEIYWDWTKGQLLNSIEYTEADTKNPVLNELGIPKVNKDGKPMFYAVDKAGRVQNKRTFIGDIGLAIRFPDTVFPNPDAWDISYNRRFKTDARWVFLMDFLTKEEIKNHDGWELPKEELKVTDKPLMSFSQQLVYELLGTEAKGSAEDEEFCEVLRYYEFPTIKYPRGRYMVILPDSEWHFLEKNDELPPPYENGVGICPLVRFYSLKTEGIFCAASRINDAGELNQEYDQMRSLQVDKIKKFQPIIFVDKSTGLKIEDIKPSIAGYIIEVNRAGMGGKDLGVQVFNPTPGSIAEKENAMMLKAEMEDLYTVHEPSRYPPERRTLGEVNLIQAYDASRLRATSVADAEEGYEDLARIKLLFAKHYYTEERIFRLMGERNRLQTHRFKGSDLGYYDIKIQPASSMPASKYVQQQRLLFLMGQGFFQDMGEEGKRLMLKMLDMKEVTPVREEDYDELNAENENYDILIGKEVKVQSEDNNKIHRSVHRIFAKSPEVRNLPKKEREKLLQKIYKHDDDHEKQEQLKEEVSLQKLQELAQQASETPPPLANIGQEQLAIGAPTPAVEPLEIQ